MDLAGVGERATGSTGVGRSWWTRTSGWGRAPAGVGEGAVASQGGSHGRVIGWEAAMATRRGGAGHERGRDKDKEEKARNKIFLGARVSRVASVHPYVR